MEEPTQLLNYYRRFQRVRNLIQLSNRNKMSHDFFLPENGPIRNGLPLLACRKCGEFKPNVLPICSVYPQSSIGQKRIVREFKDGENATPTKLVKSANSDSEEILPSTISIPPPSGEKKTPSNGLDKKNHKKTTELHDDVEKEQVIFEETDSTAKEDIVPPGVYRDNRPRKWTDREDDALIKGVAEHGKKWKKIVDGNDDLKDKTAQQLKDRYRNIVTRRVAAEDLTEK